MNSALDVALDVWASPGGPVLPLVVAFSGGADSTALLHACAARWPGQVRALHVHHGLQEVADAFAHACQADCQRLGIGLQVTRVNARHAAGESPEAAAREARYRALADGARQLGGLNVLLAQHADDQLETVLLALSRGAGVAGLAAMPGRFERGGIVFHRPWLSVSREEIEAWLTVRGLSWMEDPSNADTRYTRNRIRHEVLPALLRAFPGIRASVARSTAHAAQAQRLLDERAAQDLQAVGDPPRLMALQTLSRDRQANLLRHWLRCCGGAASTAQLSELLDQVADCRTRGHRIELRVGAGTVWRDGPALRWRYN
jgi:tRNA(Ile)-lysidine synthase